MEKRIPLLRCSSQGRTSNTRPRPLQVFVETWALTDFESETGLWFVTPFKTIGAFPLALLTWSTSKKWGPLRTKCVHSVEGI